MSDSLPLYKRLLLQQDGTDRKPQNQSKPPQQESEKPKKKAKKFAPEERSSKIPVRLFDSKDLATKQKSFRRDPRFDRLSGKLNYDLYSKSYSFLDEAAEERNKRLKTKLKQLKRKKKKKEDEYEEVKEIYEEERHVESQRRQLDNRMKLKREAKLQDKERAKKGLQPLFSRKKKMPKSSDKIE